MNDCRLIIRDYVEGKISYKKMQDKMCLLDENGNYKKGD